MYGGREINSSEERKELRQNLKTIIEQGLTHKIILEKSQSVAIWKEIVALADKIQTGNPELRRYLQTSAKYGLLFIFNL